MDNESAPQRFLINKINTEGSDVIQTFYPIFWDTFIDILRRLKTAGWSNVPQPEFCGP